MLFPEVDKISVHISTV